MSLINSLIVRLRCFVAPTFSSPWSFIYPAVSLYHMELVRKVFLYYFPSVSSVSMYARYAWVLDEEDTILPFRDTSTCEKRL